MNKSKSRNFIITTFLLGVFMGALDTSVVAPFLTTIIEKFKISTTLSTWVITIYTLAYAVSLPIIGKLADRYGRRRMFLLAVSLFGLGSLASGLALNIQWLILARALQAIGAGGIFPIASAEIAYQFPKEKRGIALGMVGGTYGVANVIGPIIGGVILAFFVWRWAFLINVPIALLIIYLALQIEEHVPREAKTLDIGGALNLTIAILLIMIAFTNLDSSNLLKSFLSFKVVGLLAISLLLLTLLAWIESKAEDPILDMKYFGKWQVVLVFLISFLTGTIMMISVFLPAFGETVVGLSKPMASLMLLPLALMMTIMAPTGGHIIDKYSPKLVLFVGFSLVLLSGLLLYFWVSFAYQLVILSILLGIGFGFTIGTPVNYLIVASFPRKEVDVGLGVNSLFRSIGTTISPIVYGGLIATASATVGAKTNKSILSFALRHHYKISQSQLDGLRRLKGIAAQAKLLKIISQLPPELEKFASKQFQQVIKVGFSKMFVLLMIIAITGLLLVALTKSRRSVEEL